MNSEPTESYTLPESNLFPFFTNQLYTIRDFLYSQTKSANAKISLQDLTSALNFANIYWEEFTNTVFPSEINPNFPSATDAVKLSEIINHLLENFTDPDSNVHKLLVSLKDKINSRYTFKHPMILREVQEI